VFFYYFERFLREYEDRFEREYGFLRPFIKDVVEIILTAAIRCVALPASGVPTVGKSACSCFPARHAD
jgi:hypothetical protein